ncbi:hypothetical protein AB205_0033470 [Aquarana catesbeiana]|uniref:C2H2-type domain-containing protein n=1 Tax=Aquarana catesbeiana TaxID=8400 RepID=A0A2G9RY94_AQUCT|nr:hypothetical protein AB205_0033470 [Aquarana catesbeiana]
MFRSERKPSKTSENSQRGAPRVRVKKLENEYRVGPLAFRVREMFHLHNSIYFTPETSIKLASLFVTKCGKCFVYRTALLSHQRLSYKLASLLFRVREMFHLHNSTLFTPETSNQLASSFVTKVREMFHLHNSTYFTPETSNKLASLCLECGKSLILHNSASFTPETSIKLASLFVTECGKSFILHNSTSFTAEASHKPWLPYCGKCLVHTTALNSHQRPHTSCGFLIRD